MASIWTETAQLPRFAPLMRDHKTDVLIIGGGLTGILCARALQEAGIDYLLVEANRLGCGISKNTTAKITAQHGLVFHKLIKEYGTEKAGIYLRANLDAIEKYRVLAENCDFERQTNYVYSLADRNLLEAELSALQALNYPARLAEKLPLPFPTAGAVAFENQAQFHILKFLAAICPGLNLFEGTKVQELTPHRAKTERGTITADKIIIATHFPMLNKHGLYFLKLYQHRSYCLALENLPIPEGMYMDESKTGLSFRSQDSMLILGGGGHRTGKSGGNWTELEQFAVEHYPGSRIRYRWAAQDCMSLDGIPYIGQYSSRTPDLYVATGFNKWGMTSAMVAAELLTKLVQGKDDPRAEIFDPGRRMLWPQLGINAFESITNLLQLKTKRCPHMGCALKWNNAERTWDCPCHGSRFEENGELIDGPATDDLKK